MKHLKTYDKFNTVNEKIGKFEPIGKYNYDVFYVDNGYEVTGTTKGDNEKHARENFRKEYGDSVIIKHLQKLKY